MPQRSSASRSSLPERPSCVDASRVTRRQRTGTENYSLHVLRLTAADHPAIDQVGPAVRGSQPMPDEPEDLADVAPEGFVAARDALAKRLKADGNATEAAEVKKLRKPTVTRWVADQVRRHHAEDVEALRAALSNVAAAQETAITSGDRRALADATAQRRDARGRPAGVCPGDRRLTRARGPLGGAGRRPAAAARHAPDAAARPWIRSRAGSGPPALEEP